MTKLDMLVDNQNLKRMLELVLEDISKHCVDCGITQLYMGYSSMLRYEPDCDRCVFGKYNKQESTRNDSSAELNLLDTYSKTVKIKNPKPISL